MLRNKKIVNQHPNLTACPAARPALHLGCTFLSKGKQDHSPHAHQRAQPRRLVAHLQVEPPQPGHARQPGHSQVRQSRAPRQAELRQRGQACGGGGSASDFSIKDGTR